MKKIVILLMLLITSEFVSYSQSIYVPKPYIIAHRGYWNGVNSVENSLDALKNAISLGVYGSEFDVWQTKDNELVICHDDVYSGKIISKSTYQDLSSTFLENGERLPTLIDFLNERKKSGGDLNLILEIKGADPKRIVKTVDSIGIGDHVEYISFTLDYCLELIRLNRGLKVYYLGGNISPDSLYNYGFSGLDYSYEVLNKNPNWIKRAKELGLKLGVYTINGIENIYKYFKLGFDLITTDTPFYTQDPIVNISNGYLYIIPTDRLSKMFYSIDFFDPDLYGQEYSQPVYLKGGNKKDIYVIAKRTGYFKSNIISITCDSLFSTNEDKIIGDDISHLEYFDINGKRIESLKKGLNIIEFYFNNNTRKSKKIFLN